MKAAKRPDPNTALISRKNKPNGRYKNRLSGFYPNTTNAVKKFFDWRFSNEDSSFDEKTALPIRCRYRFDIPASIRTETKKASARLRLKPGRLPVQLALMRGRPGNEIAPETHGLCPEST
ncbi:hypothetical protein [Desulfatirhabdium butyrativorans]|uniref:hypothetical protein n=1 Tax=Desulfatirhabdium butyrativorans TaxID=340467 RepID=UPI0012EBB8D7|nr:hypothetical protein [Desulfatirhabdium butyrativorans]